MGNVDNVGKSCWDYCQQQTSKDDKWYITWEWDKKRDNFMTNFPTLVNRCKAIMGVRDHGKDLVEGSPL